MPAPKKNPLTNLIKKGAKKAVVKVKPKPKAPTDKATKRGLKAANAKLSKGNATRQYNKDKVDMVMKSNPKFSREEAELWSTHPGYASLKSNARLREGKWSTEKQQKRYQKSEIKDFRNTKIVNKKTK